MNTRLGQWAAALALTLIFGSTAFAAASRTPASGPMSLAIMQAPTGTPLEAILSGRAGPGFTPVVAAAAVVAAEPGQSYWLRLRWPAGAPTGARILRLDRQELDRLRLYSPNSPTRALVDTGPNDPSQRTARWADSFALPLPADVENGSTLYLEARGRGYLSLRPQLLSKSQWASRLTTGERFYRGLYAAFGLILLLALVRRVRGIPEASSVALAAAACLLAELARHRHLNLVPALGALDGVNPNLPYILWIVACAGLIRATRDFAYLGKNAPVLAVRLDRAVYVLPVLAIAVWFVVPAQLALLQLAVFALLLLACPICILALSRDRRHTRWPPMLAWLALLPALLVLPFAMHRPPPPTSLARYGFEALLALVLAFYLLLPWLRQAVQERDKRKRAIVPELSAEEKIADAHARLTAGLEAGLANAGVDDLNWIAYRRLLEGLQRVLPQVSSAVVTMNYHDQDLLQVEPKSAEARYQLLLKQRGGLLKILSRSKGPQQVLMDFDGPEGPLPPVCLAVIPLPIEKPSWGAVLIERKQGVGYGQQELALCAQFAASACAAVEKAAEAMKAQRGDELDSETGVLRRRLVESMLEPARQAAVEQGSPLSMLRIAIDDFDQLPPPSKLLLMRALADAIREEADYGDIVGRWAADELLVLVLGRPLGLALDLAERIRHAAGSVPLKGAAKLSLSIGVSQFISDETSCAPLEERVARALVKARQQGGNQVQSASGAIF